MFVRQLVLLAYISNTYFQSAAKIHHVTVKDEKSPYIHLVDFGFLSGGLLQVELTNFTYATKYSEIGFTLSKGDEINDYLKATSDCLLKSMDTLSNAIYFKFQFDKKNLIIFRSGEDLQNLEICSGTAVSNFKLPEKCYEFVGNTTGSRDQRRVVEKRDSDENTIRSEPLQRIPLEECSSASEFSASFTVRFWNKSHDGSYYLYFHNCYNFDKNVKEQIGVSFKADIVAKNENSYLSSGEIPNPHLYFTMAILFFCTGVIWVYFLKTTKESVYKIHYLMAVLVIIKSFSLLFHGVNFYFISLYGQQQELWAIVYYVMHLLKGMLLFGVIILIGTGWTFFKNFLTDRDRKLFMVIIPMQVLDNIALIIIAESEIGQKNYGTWERLFILIDLVCCAAIILPVIWSIRHLQESSQTDGKAAFSLRKLKLFRHFYILIICYIYLTRIIKYLIVYTVPFQYTYVVVIVEEVGSWLFYVLTGYKFKPAPNNPYLKLALNDDDSEDMEDVIMQSGALENVVRVNRAGSTKKMAETKLMQEGDIEEEEEIFVHKEISHELD